MITINTYRINQCNSPKYIPLDYFNTGYILGYDHGVKVAWARICPRLKWPGGILWPVTIPVSQVILPASNFLSNIIPEVLGDIKFL